MVWTREVYITCVNVSGKRLGNGVPTVEFFPGRVEVSFHTRQPEGSWDQKVNFSVPLHLVDSLPAVVPPELAGWGRPLPEAWTSEKRYVRVELPPVGKHLIFVYEKDVYFFAYGNEWDFAEAIWGPYVEPREVKQ